MFLSQTLRLRKITRSHPARLAQNDYVSNNKHSFTAGITNVNVDWKMVITIKVETETVLFKNLRHAANLRQRTYKSSRHDAQTILLNSSHL